MARAVWGDNRMSTMNKEGKESEYGYLRYKVAYPENKFLRDLPREFVSSAYHRDCFLLDKKEQLIHSRNWSNQAFQVPDRRSFGGKLANYIT
jgi:GMP synthase-like glutamine amidotransferase